MGGRLTVRRSAAAAGPMRRPGLPLILSRSRAPVGQDGDVPRHPPRHDHDAGGPADLLAAKAALREQVWAAMSAALRHI